MTVAQKLSAAVKMLVMDVDGTLTDGKIYYYSDGTEGKAFDVKDGYAIKHFLPQMGIVPVIITGRISDIVSRRAEELGSREVHQGIQNKIELFDMLLEKYGVGEENVAYIGDDLNDLPFIQKVGLSFCPCDAAEEIRKAVDITLMSAGGNGAVRECVEWLMQHTHNSKEGKK